MSNTGSNVKRKSINDKKNSANAKYAEPIRFLHSRRLAIEPHDSCARSMGTCTINPIGLFAIFD